MNRGIGFKRFVALTEVDAPKLLERMSNQDLRVDGERYGITTRLIAKPNTTVAQLGVAVLQRLCEVSGLEPEKLGAIVLSSRIRDVEQSADEIIRRSRINCEAHGIERACSGFPVATQLAQRVCLDNSKPVAIIAAEIISRNINWEPADGNLSDHHRARGQAASLFADGAAAVLVQESDGEEVCEILDAWAGDVPDNRQLIQKTDVENTMDPWGNNRPGITECLSMPGRRGFVLLKRAPQIMADAVCISLTKMKSFRKLGEELHVVPHQPNGLIITALEKRLAETLGTPPRVWNYIKDCGNTVSASIPLAMADVQSSLSAGTLVAMSSVGAGGPGYRPDVLSTGCVLFRMSGK